MNNNQHDYNKLQQRRQYIIFFSASIIGIIIICTIIYAVTNLKDSKKDTAIRIPKVNASAIESKAPKSSSKPSASANTSSAPTKTTYASYSPVSTDAPTNNPVSTPSNAPSSLSVINMNSWNLILVNPWRKLPDDFSVKRTKINSNHSIDERAYPDLQDMLSDARAQGLKPYIRSSYRTPQQQQSLYVNQVNKRLAKGYSREVAEAEAAQCVAPVGTSEHQAGLALDIVSSRYRTLNKKQEETPEQIWLMANSYKYGFILRYPSDKSDITGIMYEPWHYRYVGKEIAKEIYDQGVCLEEYLGATEH